MKFIIIIMLMIPVTVSGQLFSLSDFYVFNGLVINPAFAGNQDALSLNLQYRNQWAGFKDAPRSGLLSAHAPFYYDRMGLGIVINQNSYGIYRGTNIMGNYAFRFNLHKGKMALGLGFGIKSCHISWSELQAADPGDFLLNDNSFDRTNADFSLGAFYETKKYFLGVSLPWFLHQSGSRSYFLTGGYSFWISENLDINPSLLLSYNPQTNLQGDFLLKADIFRKVGAGAGFRSTGMLMGIISCNINSQLSFYYSFDTDSGHGRHYRKGSHEIMIGYTFSYFRNVRSPAEI